MYTDKTFIGKVDMINTNFWGSPKRSIELNGTGKMTMIGGKFLHSTAPLVDIRGGR